MSFIFLTGNIQLFRNHFNLLNLDNIYLVLLITSAGFALLFSLVDGVFSDRIMRFFPRRMMIFLKSILYLLSVFVLIFLFSKPSFPLLIKQNYKELIEYIPKYFPEFKISFIRFLVYFYLAIFLINFFKSVEKKIGKGNFRGWMLGMLNKPMEQERIFMFIDMKSSTSRAEQLKHKKYSHLVQDVFNDLSIVSNYDGEIYQYLGDGAIISWSLKSGLKRNNCLKAFFAFQRLINKRGRYYKRKYNKVPEFKAGLHAGKVMVLQVGQVRRDISYNGDTINTAARIESVCNDYKQNLLISGDLYNLLKDKSEFTMVSIDKLNLRGKRKAIELFYVKEKRKKNS